MAETPARTLGFSSRRKTPVSYRNVLNSPYKLKWPELSAELASEVSERLRRDLADLFVAARTNLSSRQAENSGRITERRSTADGGAEETRSEGLLVEGKKPDGGGSCGRGDHVTSNRSTTEKKQLLIVGVNAVTRQLERDNLRVGLVCLSAKPGLLTHHIMMLAATRGCPVLAIPDLSSTVAPLLGIKSALAVGFKKVTESDDPFYKLVTFLVARAPPIQIPWLTVSTETLKQVSEEKVTVIHDIEQGHSDQEDCAREPMTKRGKSGSGCRYASLQIKTTIKKGKQRYSS